MTPTPEQLECVRVVASAEFQRLNQEDEKLAKFCDDKLRTDVFNQCIEAGWLMAWHNSIDDSGSVAVTDEGRAMLAHHDP